jgi:hypothetical protein
VTLVMYHPKRNELETWVRCNEFVTLQHWLNRGWEVIGEL